jgi:hypothetical protein
MQFATAQKDYSARRLLELALKGVANPNCSEKFKEKLLEIEGIFPAEGKVRQGSYPPLDYA